MKKLFSLLMCSMLMLCCASCTPENNKEKEKLQIVTTIFPLYDFARQVGGEKADVSLLLQSGAEVHSYEPSPQDVIRIKESDLFIHLGMGADPWTDAVISSSDTKPQNVLSAMEYADLLGEEHSHDHSSQMALYDQHIWTSIENAGEIAEAIKDALCRIDAKNAQYYEKRAQGYEHRLSLLDEKFEELTKNHQESTIVFADRFAFRYFTEEYKLNHFAAFPGCSSESEPSARTVSQLIDMVKKEKIPVVFYTETSNQKLADAVCEETGAEKMLLHSCHTVTREQLESGITYTDLMENNYEALKKALY